MDIGHDIRTIIVEPLKEPVPRAEPDRNPDVPAPPLAPATR